MNQPQRKNIISYKLSAFSFNWLALYYREIGKTVNGENVNIILARMFVSTSVDELYRDSHGTSRSLTL